MDKGYLVLADGHVFVGELFNAPNEPWVGELVFSTAMTGYTEILSDPSFLNQIVVLTSAEIGNYGVSASDFQSEGAKAKALIVRNFTERSYSCREQYSLNEWLSDQKIPLLSGIDTRALVIHMRNKGSMMAAIGAESHSLKELIYTAKNAISMAGFRLSPFVSVSQPEIFSEGPARDAEHHIVVMDFGVKREILRYLKSLNAQVTLVPGSMSAHELWKLEPDGVCLSNGPGDPFSETEAVKTVAHLLGKIPIFGICLGHQILAQAMGFSTYKLKCGHRGSNHPIKTCDGKIIVSAQNHGFAVSDDDAPNGFLLDKNLNDGTNEGLHMPHLWAFSVQFHPEGAPGPKDATHYFQRFLNNIEAWKIERHQSERRATLNL